MAEIATLDYGYVLDICAQQVYHSKTALVVCDQDSFLRQELLKRLEQHAATFIDADALQTWDGIPSTIIWAAPLPTDAVFKALCEKCSGTLYLITAGTLAPLLRSSHTYTSGWRAVVSAAGRSGFQITTVEGFNSIASFFLGYASRVLKRLKRDEWADRCLAKMRADYVVHGWQTWLTTVNLITARKPQP